MRNSNEIINVLTNFKKLSFRKRFISKLFSIYLFILIILIYVALNLGGFPSWALVTLALFLFTLIVFYAYNSYNESKIYIYRIEVAQDTKVMTIHYLNCNKDRYLMDVSLDSLSLKIYSNGFGISGIQGWKIDFFNQGERFFTQWSVKEWSPKYMKDFKNKVGQC